MPIPVESVVNVSISIGAQFPARAGFGTLNIVTAESGVIGIAERIRSYSNIEGVSADWPANSEVVAAATSYFSQQPKPTSLKVSVRFPTDQAGQLRGGGVANNATNIAAFTAISDGSFTISIDGSSQDITGIDFSSDVDMDDIADAIQAALRAVASGGYSLAVCTYDAATQRFLISSGTLGATSTVSFMTTAPSGTDISSLLQMQQGEGINADGVVAETITASLNAIESVDSNWYGLAFTNEVRDLVTINTESAVAAAAAWTEARTKTFFNTTNDLDALDSATTTDIASVLDTANYRRTMTTYSSFPSEYPSVSAAGRAFTVNFAQVNSTITLKFKQLPGVSTESLNVNQLNVLHSKSANALVDVGGSSMFSDSRMADGAFFDEVHGLDWLEDAIQTALFGYLLTRTTKVPYTNKGLAALEQQLINVLDEGVRNGLIAPGNTIDGTFLPNGYQTIVVPVESTAQADIEARFYGGLSAVVLGAGAIHGLQVGITFER